MDGLQIPERIFATAATYYFSGFQMYRWIYSPYVVYRLAVYFHSFIYQVNCSSINSYRICSCKYSNIFHKTLTGKIEAITSRCNIINPVDITDTPFERLDGAKRCLP